MEDQANLVKKLYDHSRKGQIPWQVTQANGRFSAVFKSGSVDISLNERFDMQEEETVHDVVFDIYNEKGRLVDSFSDVTLNQSSISPPHFNSWFSVCNNLFEIARRNASGADKVVKGIIQEIELDDDIPF